MKRKATLLFILALTTAGGVLAADQPTRWLNVHVTELTEGANIEVHLPLSLVLAALESINVDNFHAGKVDLDIEDAEIDWPQLFRAIKDAPDGEFVKVDAPDANVRVTKQAGTILIDVNQKEEEQAVVKVTVPASMIEALTIDENNQMDVAAFLRSFETLPSGDLVTVDSSEAKVRVWIE